jgi:hypothetical protein
MTLDLKPPIYFLFPNIFNVDAFELLHLNHNFFDKLELF